MCKTPFSSSTATSLPGNNGPLLDGANIWSALQGISRAGVGLQITNVTDAIANPAAQFVSLRSGAAANNDSVYNDYFVKDSAASANRAIRTYAVLESVTNGAENGRLSGGSLTLFCSFAHNGVTIGSLTGGSKGAGTLNAAGDIYKNDIAYTNPDYALEHLLHWQDRALC